ncbi:diguanylate cyclase [Paucibacter sediminis]|uniref:Diguanylate cyclase n=1 Tax=Paucibacter sediminis TaxID=3019553 RepID=A0AA95NM97_9BURK|nr:diguanylate cyclase [Paucibacter sp. S2-9]WIT13936.1 diguanylate cyclase [Paucibacter sp. S2-9]
MSDSVAAKPWIPPQLNQARRTWYAVLCFVLLLWGALLWLLLALRQEIAADDTRHLRQLRGSVASQSDALFLLLDTGLHELAAHLQRQPNVRAERNPAFMAQAQAMSRASGGLLELGLIDAAGRLRYPLAAASATDVDVTDRPYFQRLLQRPAERLELGEPTLSRTDGSWILPISLRMSAPAAGVKVLTGSLSLDRLAAQQLRFLPEAAGAVSWIRDDGVMIMRTPFDPNLVGADLSSHPDYLQLRARESAEITSAGLINHGAQRRLSAERLRHAPVSVLLSQDLMGAMQYFNRLALSALLAGGLLSGLALAWARRLGRVLNDIDRTRAAHRELAAELVAVQDAAPLGLFRCDLHGQIVYVNDTWRQIHGLPAPSHPDDWTALLPETASDAITTDTACRSDRRRELLLDGIKRVRRSDGRELELSLRSAPMRVNGRIVGHVGTVEDITQRRASEVAQGMLAAVFESSSDWVMQHDRLGRLFYMNTAARRTMGLTDGAALGGLDLSRSMPDWANQKRLREILPQALVNGSWSGESAVLDAQGREIPVSHMLIVHRDSRGRIEYFSTVLRDISRIKAAEAGLRESEARLRSVTDRLPMGVAFVDTERRLRFLNRNYAQLMGLDRDQAYGQRLADVLGGADYAEIIPHVERALGGQVGSLEVEKTTARGYACWQTRFLPEFAADQQAPIGMVIVVADATGQKLEERRLHRLTQTDALTGLLNRSGFELALTQALHRGRFSKRGMALFYLDIDRFKSINDSLGHQVGDLLLRGFSGRLSRTLRSEDAIARLGGDEFIIVVEQLDQVADAELIAQNLVSAMRPPFQLEDRAVQVTTSVGALVWNGGLDLQADEVIRAADALLYRAKRAGRNGYCLECRA